VYTAANPHESQLTWYDRSGNALGVVGKPALGLRASISKDGSMLAIDRSDPRTGVIDVWLLNIANRAETRLTFHEARNRLPVWSPDGRRIAFNSGRNLVQRVLTGPGQNNGTEDLLDSPRGGEAVIKPVDWSHDGRYIVERVVDQRTKSHLWVLPLVGDRKAFRYLRTESNEEWGQVSPNGRWLAYASDESKRFEVYVQTFPSPGDKSQVSIDGGTLPVWSRNGKELFYIARDGKMMAVSVKGATVNDSARFEAGTPTALFDAYIPAGVGARYDVGNDGRFLIATPIQPPGGQQITVLFNWIAALKKVTAGKGVD
jgi:Tol biopolymer transport system component